MKDITSIDNDAIEGDKAVVFYYTNLVNSIILFSLTTNELQKLADHTFDPLFELESEIDYAYMPICFETIFRKGIVDNSLKTELLEFKKQTDEIPKEIWNWSFIDNHKTWMEIRQKANNLLTDLGITHRIYNDTYTTIYDSEGNIIKPNKITNVTSKDITNIILPFQHFWISLIIITILSFTAFPIAAHLHAKLYFTILNGRENISVLWMTLVGLGVSIGIHYRTS